jgi:membrane associated rhomboid family serine protease
VDERDAATGAPACYRHPDREALLRCSRCERPICSDDAIEAPVGYQCPECAAGGQPVRHLRELMPSPQVTKVLLGIVVVVFLATQADQQGVFATFGLIPVLVGQGQWWLLVTSAFLHAGLMHVAFNGFLLWRLGEMLEPVLGHLRFGALYLAGLAGGGLGVVGLAWLTAFTPLASIPLLGFVFATGPASVTVGASGAVFGLMGAAMAGMRARGVDPWRTDVGSLVLLNLVITFLIPGISVGGHLGGLLAGFVAGKVLFVDAGRARRAATVTFAAAVAVLLGTTLLF